MLINIENRVNNISPFHYILFLFCGTILLSVFACQSPGTPLTNEQSAIVNTVVNDVFKNQNYKLNCKIDPRMGNAKDYGGDFSSIVNAGLGSLQNGAQVLANMNQASALQIGSAGEVAAPDSLVTSLSNKKDTIPRLANRENVILKMSTIGFSDDQSECIIIADRIYGLTNKIRFVYYFRKDGNGAYQQVDKKTIYHFDPVENLNLGYQKKEEAK